MIKSVKDILELNVSERIQLVEDIWDSITEMPESITLNSKQAEELDNRLKLYHQNPSEGLPWEAVRRRIKDEAKQINNNAGS